MDKRNLKKQEQPDGKTEKCDRGDLSKYNERPLNNSVQTVFHRLPDRGDSERKSKPDKKRIMENPKTDKLRDTNNLAKKIETVNIPFKNKDSVTDEHMDKGTDDLDTKMKVDNAKKVPEVHRIKELKLDNFGRKEETGKMTNRHTFNIKIAQSDKIYLDRKIKADKIKKNLEIQKICETDNCMKRIEGDISRAKNIDTLNIRVYGPERGDIDKKAKVDRNRLAVVKKPENRKDDEQSDYIVKNIIFDVTQNKNTELEDRRRVRDNKTVKPKIPNGGTPPNALRREIYNAKKNATKKANIIKSYLESNKIDSQFTKPMVTKEKQESTPSSKGSVEKDPPRQKRPIIKTFTSKNDATKIYKAVTFVERKQKPTTIKVKLPDEYVGKSPKTSETSAVIKKFSESSKESFQSKEVKDLAPKGRSKKNKVKRLIESPDTLVRDNSPQTEVAKWAPSCINKHTKPYYEAWVSTTLAAISKTSKKDKLFLEKQHILESFQRALAMRPETPDLVYENINDERYTGRITVRQR